MPLHEIISLNGKTAIVTGGALGIGKGIAVRLAEAGANVAIFDLKQDDAKRTAEEIRQSGHKASAFTGNVAEEKDVQALVQSVMQEYGGIDILVNNAGIFPNILLREMSRGDFESVLSTNLIGAFLCTKYVCEEMIRAGKGGRIINITSIDAIHPSMVGLAHYDASKHGLWGFTKNAALEYAPHKIWINAIAPGGINTPGVGAMNRTQEMQRAVDAFAQQIPMKRMGEPDDIGKTALFLASELSGYMTGAQIVVDGGYLLT
jgi:2-deoxy-D-gluconate 3-dehydrogenase